MKTLSLFLTVLFISALSITASAQANGQGKMNAPAAKTESFKVSGNCGMCKDRIEKAAKDEGATSASWDSKTQLLTVTFDPSKTNKDALSKKIASVGHDTEKYKAPDDVYSKLPGCCHYDRLK
jgi:copper chaperone CopZ